MIKGTLSAKLAGWMLAVAVGAAVGGSSTPAAALPTTWILQNAVFEDGGTASGKFTINVYGYLSEPTHIDTSAGTLLGAHTYTLADPSSITSAHIVRRTSEGGVKLLETLLPFTKPGELLRGEMSQQVFRSYWDCASAASFQGLPPKAA